jgi:hypothetical protein
VQTPTSWLLCPFDTSPSFFEYFLTSWHKKVFPAHLLLPLTQTQPLLQGALVLKHEMPFEYQGLGEDGSLLLGSAAPRTVGRHSQETHETHELL